MKTCLRNKKRNINFPQRWLSILIAACLLFQNSAFCLKAFAAAEEEAFAFNVPYGEELTGYDPLKDGYYAYLQVKYEDCSAPISEKGKTYIETYLPVAVRQGHLLMDIDYFASITGAEVFEKESPSGGARIRLNVFNRYVFLGEGKDTIYYFLGNDEDPSKWLDQTAFTIEVAPQVIDGCLYIPFLDVLGALQIPFDIVDASSLESADADGGKYLQIEQPRRNVYDVLAEIKNDDSPYRFTYGDADLTALSASSNVCMTLHGMLQFDWQSWARVLASGTIVFAKQGEEIWDGKQCVELVKRLLSISEDEGSFIDEINSVNAIELTSYLMHGAAKVKSINNTQSFEDALQILLDMPGGKIRDAFLKSNLTNYTKALASLDDSNKFINNIDGKLSDVSDTLVIIGTTADCICNIITYVNSDNLICNGMNHLFSKEYRDKYRYPLYYLGEENLARIEKEFSELSEDVFSYSAAKAFSDNISNIIGAALKTGNPFTLLYGITSKHIPYYGDALDAMENFNLSMYAIPFQNDTRNAALNCIDDLRLGASDDTEVVDGIELGYVYLKTCYVARDCAIRSFTRKGKEKFSSTINPLKHRNDEIAKNLAIMKAGYPTDRSTADVTLPPRAQDCIEDNFLNHTEDKIRELLIPLYMKVSGEVREKSEGEPPVVDAVCEIKIGGDQAGRFEGKGDGTFSVYVPVMKPEEELQDLSVLDNLQLSLEFTSPTVEGKGQAKAEFEPKAEAHLGIIYLGGFNWYEYIRDELAPKFGYADTEDLSARVTNSNYWKVTGWNERSGIISADVIDMTEDGQEDLLLYRFDYTQNYALLAELYIEDNGTVNRVGRLEISSAPDEQFILINECAYISLRAGIISVQDHPYLWAELCRNTYFANAGGFDACFYGWDGSEFRMSWMNGKSHGGSSGIVYSLREYNDDENYVEEIFYTGDNEYFHFHPEARKQMHQTADSEEEAVEMGYSFLGLPEPRTETYDLCGGGYSKNDPDYPTYWDTDYLKKSVELNISGPVYLNNIITDSVQDYTNLRQIIDELE